MIKLGQRGGGFGQIYHRIHWLYSKNPNLLSLMQEICESIIQTFNSKNSKISIK
jgi:hypothetical protein